MGIMTVRKLAHKLLAPVIIVLVIGLTIGLFYIGLPNYAQDSYNYKGPAAEVNGEKIKDADFNKVLMEVYRFASTRGAAVSESELLNMTLTESVKRLALEQEKRKAKIHVSGREISQFIDKSFPTEEQRISYTNQMGITEKQLRKQAADIISLRKMIAYKARQFKIKPNAQVLREEMEQITVSHILIGQGEKMQNKRSQAEAIKLANEVYQKVAAGGDFAQLAKEYSDDFMSREKGGQLTPMSLNSFKSQMVKEFVTATLALKKGQFSRPVKSEYGYHIIRLDSRTIPQGADYKKKLREVEEELLIKQGYKIYEQWVEDLYTKALDNMKILDPGLKAYRFGLQGMWNEATIAYQKALQRSYYKKRWSFHYEAAQAYIKAQQPQEAVKLLRKIPAEGQQGLEYQLALAEAYRADNKMAEAKQVLADYSRSNPQEIEIHQRLKEVYLEWKLPELAAAEERVIAEINRIQAEKLQLEQKNQELKNESVFPTTTTPTSGK